MNETTKGPKAEMKPAPSTEPAIAELRHRYSCDPYEFAGTENALYDRHLIFDHIVNPDAARFARALRSVRALHPRHSFAKLGEDREDLVRKEPKAGLLSLDGVSHRPLASNNVTNLLLDPMAKQAVKDENLDWLAARAGAGRGTGQRGTRTAGGLFPGLHGDDGASCHGIRPPLRIRNLQADH